MRVELSPLLRFAGVVAVVAAAGIVWIATNPGKTSFRSESLAIVKTPGIMVPDISALLPETSGANVPAQ